MALPLKSSLSRNAFAIGVLVAGSVPPLVFASDVRSDVAQMEVFRVLEDPVGVIGFNREFELHGLGLTGRIQTVRIYRVFPNTAASKGGLRPGDVILSSDGVPVPGMTKRRFDAIFREKRQLGESGLPMAWELSVQSEGENEPRIVRLALPAPAPWWGSPRYSAPEGREPAKVVDAGPLAEKAKIILDNGYLTILPTRVARRFGLYPGGKSLLCFGWSVDADGATHSMLVSQQRGTTDVILMKHSKGVGSSAPRFYLTAPSGILRKAVTQKGRAIENPIEEAEDGFRKEVEFWLTRIGKVSLRWPLEVITVKR